MAKDREDPKTDHEKFLHQNTTDEKGPQKEDHYDQYGKKNQGHKERAAKKED